MMNALDQLYADIRDHLPLSLKGLLTSTFHQEDDGESRSPEQAAQVLDTLHFFAKKIKELQENNPSLVALFEVDYGPIADLEARDSIIEICYLDDFLFPENEECPLLEDGVFRPELLVAYQTSFEDWLKVKLELHTQTQDLIKNNFSTKLEVDSFECQCASCQGEFRAKLRDQIFAEQVKLIDQAEERLHEAILVKKIDQVSDDIYELRKKIEKILHENRYKVRRATLNKLDSDIKAHFKDKFSPNSSLGKVYKEKLRIFFNTCLVEQDLKPELINEEEFQRFFSQLGTNIWKPAKFLKREFQIITKAILSIKRKDISATILREYLGQFWLHAEARKLNRKVIYHMGPTNSGKTYHAIEALCKAKKGCYLAPLRLLASELYDTMNEKGVKTTLLTGEEVIEVPESTHYSSTIEMAKLTERFECCVIDEVQMMSDPQRGWAWTRALVNIHADEIHLCGDHSVLGLVEKILKLTGDTLEIKEYTRMTELKIEERPTKVNALQKGDAVIVFSRRNALKFKRLLEDHDFKVSIVYGRLSPEVRREQARKFDQGETDIIVSTDAIAMGMNLPVRRIVFSALSKFIDNKEFPLSDSEIKQISGRAGRFNRFPIGFVTCLEKVEGGLERLHSAIQVTLAQSDKAMVGPDLEIFRSVNMALEGHSLPTLKLTEFLRLFNTMIFDRPFFCVDLNEMIELAEMVEGSDREGTLTNAESFGFSCAPVNLGLLEHVQYFIWILNHYSKNQSIINEEIRCETDNIDYLETAIKCVELYQWLARHFDNKNFVFDQVKLLANKTQAIERLNELLSDKTSDAQLGYSSRPPGRRDDRRAGENGQKEWRRGPSRPQVKRRSGSGEERAPEGDKKGPQPYRPGKKKKVGTKKTASGSSGGGAASAFKRHR